VLRGGNPHTRFREAASFDLPNSGLRVHLTTRVAYDLESERRRTQVPAVVPDLLVEPTAGEYFGGRDRALEAVLGPPPGSSAAGDPRQGR